MGNEFNEMLDRRIDNRVKQILAEMFLNETRTLPTTVKKTPVVVKSALVETAAATGTKSFKGIRGVAKDPKNDKRFKANRAKTKK